MLEFEFKLNKEDDGYWVSEPVEVTLANGTKETVGVNTQGDTIEELKSNIQDALCAAYERNIGEVKIILKE